MSFLDYCFENMDMDYDHNTGEAGPSPFGRQGYTRPSYYNSYGYFGLHKIREMTDDHLSRAIHCLTGQLGAEDKQRELKAEQVRREFECL